MLLNSWQAALRIAARESRRARGRSALVVAMIALPVLALSFAAVTYDMFTLTPAERLDRRLGAADAQVTWLVDGPVRQDVAGDGWTDDVPAGDRAGSSRASETPVASVAEVTAALPPGSRAIAQDASAVWRLRAGGVSRQIPVRRFDATDPLTRGMVLRLDGRFPTAVGELALSENAAGRFDVGIGDQLDVQGARPHTVVGLVEFPDDLGEVALASPPRGPQPGGSWLIDVPGDLDWDLVRQLNLRGMVVTSRSVVLDPPALTPEMAMLSSATDNGETVRLGLLAGGLGLLEVVLLAGPAFAVGARRRRRDLAMIAANGGTLAHLRRVVLADGVVLGLTGAVIGLVLGVTVAVGGRPLVEAFLATERAGGYRFFPAALLAIAGLAVLAGVLACLVPAYSAARQDVVSALTGRRGAVRSRRRWLVAGLALTGVGGGAAAYGASRVDSDLILAGLTLGEIGLVFCTPSLVGLLARLGRPLPPAPRIALRDTARNRAAAAPAISAVMAAVAGSVALGVYLASDAARADAMRQPVVPMGYANLSLDPSSHLNGSIPLDLLTEVAAEAGLEVAEAAVISEPACPATDPADPAPVASPLPAEPAPELTAEAYCGLDVRIPPERLCPYPYGPQPLPVEQRRRALADPRCTERVHIYGAAVASSIVDDGTALPLLTDAATSDVARAREVLAAGGVVVTDPRQLHDGTVTVEIIRPGPGGSESSSETVTLPGYLLTSGLSAPRTFYSPAAVARAGLSSRSWGYVMATRSMPTQAAQERFAAALRVLAPGLHVEVERGAGARSNPALIVLALAAGIITLGAAGIATGLAAADGRADLTTLAAVGASPRMRRSLSLSQSGVIAGLGSLLGIGAGLGAGFAVLAALNQGYASAWPPMEPFPVTVPWTTLGVLIVVPLVAMLGAGLLTRSQLPIERRRD